MVLLNTQQLREKLIVSRSTIDDWVEYEKAKIDAMVEKQRLSREQNQRRIDLASADLLALQFEGGLAMVATDDDNDNEENHNTNNEKQLQQQHKQTTKKKKNDKERDDILQQQKLAKDDIDELQTKLQEKQLLVEEYNEELKKERQASVDASKQKESAIATKNDEINKLTNSIHYYQSIGLDFDKDPNDSMLRFTFTQLDPNDPNRKFTFCLRTGLTDDDDDVDGSEEYVMPDLLLVDNDNDSKIDDEQLQRNNNNNHDDNDDEKNSSDAASSAAGAVHNIIPRDALLDMLDQLNRTDDMSEFICSIRKALIGSL